MIDVTDRMYAPYNPKDWYWYIRGDETQFWSSKLGAWVPEAEVPQHAGVTGILNETELSDVLWEYEIAGPIKRFKKLAPYQWEAILDLADIRTLAENLVNNLPEPDRTVARARMKHSLGYHRDDILLAALVPLSGMTPEEVDALWDWAAGL